MIKKEKNKYVVYNKTGTKKLGTHATKASATNQLRAIEANKHK